MAQSQQGLNRKATWKQVAFFIKGLGKGSILFVLPYDNAKN